MLLVALVVSGLVVAPPAAAESCEAHLAKHGTSREADIAYHLANGGESPCGYVIEQQQSQQQRSDKQQDTSYNDKSNDRKSKYCRQRWFC